VPVGPGVDVLLLLSLVLVLFVSFSNFVLYKQKHRKTHISLLLWCNCACTLMSVIARMKRSAYEVLMANLIQHATPLSYSLHPCNEQSLPNTQVNSMLIFAALLQIDSDTLTLWSTFYFQFYTFLLHYIHWSVFNFFTSIVLCMLSLHFTCPECVFFVEYDIRHLYSDG